MREPGVPQGKAGMRWALFAFVLLALILIPFVLFEEPITSWSKNLLAHPGKWAGPAIAGLLALDIFLPIPSSMVSTASGALLGLWGGTLASTVGMTAGSLAGYAVGRSAGPTTTAKIVGEAGTARVRRLWEQHGGWTLVVLRAVPVLAEASVVFAGLARMPLGRFLLINGAANACVSAAYAAAGAYALGARSFLAAFAAAILFPLAGMLLARVLSRRADLSRAE